MLHNCESKLQGTSNPQTTIISLSVVVLFFLLFPQYNKSKAAITIFILRTHKWKRHFETNGNVGMAGQGVISAKTVQFASGVHSFLVSLYIDSEVYIIILIV